MKVRKCKICHKIPVLKEELFSPNYLEVPMQYLMCECGKKTRRSPFNLINSAVREWNETTRHIGCLKCKEER